MSRFLGTAGLTAALNGVPTYLGTIAASTTSKTQATTAVPFTIPTGVLLLLVADAAVVFTVGSSVTATTGIPLAATEKWTTALRQSSTGLAAITASGTANLLVFRLE